MIRAALAAVGLLAVAHTPVLVAAALPVATVAVTAEVLFVAWRVVRRKVRYP